VVRLPSFPNYASAEMSVSFSLELLRIELNVIQAEGKGSEVTQFSQLREWRYVREHVIGRTRNVVE
jgi:hypothetical protein